MKTIILILFLIPCVLEAKKVKEVLDINSKWEFLARFCFLSFDQSGGKDALEYDFKYPVSYGVQNLLFYYDTPGQWEAVYKRGKTCDEKFAILDNRNYFSLNDNGICSVETIGGEDNYVCKGSVDFSSARERWWYMVISRCDDANDQQYNDRMYLDYELHMTNGDDFLHQEYSADEFYIVIINIIFFVLYLALMVASIFVAVVLTKKQLFHTTYKMYMAAMTFWLLHLFCGVIAWTSYGASGWEMGAMEVLGRVLQSISNVIFILMLILVAKGYTIVRGKLKPKAFIKITVFISLFIVATIAMFIWEAAIFDEGLVLYYYESPPGYGMVLITLLGWLWFTKAIVFTMKHYHQKTIFYIVFYTLYTIWFWASPVTILMAMISMDKWAREKTVTGVEQFIGFCGHGIFFFLTMPNRVNSNFPYHVKTTQIGIMEEEEETEQSPYTHIDRVYWSGTGPNLDFFITSKEASSNDENTRMYPPLEARPGDPGSSRTNDSPPPPYPQALSLEQYPPANANGSYSNPSFVLSPENLPPPERNGILPPLSPFNTDFNNRGATTLPPIRATGLPPIAPSAPPEEGPSSGRDLNTMFSATKQ